MVRVVLGIDATAAHVRAAVCSTAGQLGGFGEPLVAAPPRFARPGEAPSRRQLERAVRRASEAALARARLVFGELQVVAAHAAIQPLWVMPGRGGDGSSAFGQARSPWLASVLEGLPFAPQAALSVSDRLFAAFEGATAGGWGVAVSGDEGGAAIARTPEGHVARLGHHGQALDDSGARLSNGERLAAMVRALLRQLRWPAAEPVPLYLLGRLLGSPAAARAFESALYGPSRRGALTGVPPLRQLPPLLPPLGGALIAAARLAACRGEGEHGPSGGRKATAGSFFPGAFAERLAPELLSASLYGF